MVSGALLTSAGGVLSLLDEAEEEIQVFALSRLDELVDVFWAEIAESITKIEVLYENDSFPERELAALVASKVYYHLGSFQDSLMFALKAGSRFDVNHLSEYTETIISKCIDHYTMLRIKKFDGGVDGEQAIDPRLESVVNRMFERCFEEHKFQQAAGIALETRRIDLLERAIQESRDVENMLSYCLKVTLSLLNSRKFRNMVLQVLVRIYSGLKTPDYINICQCYIFLDDAESTAQILEKLSRGNLEEVLTAYQIAFDLYESATQQFLSRVQECFRGVLPAPLTPNPSTEEAEKLSEEKMDTTGDKEVSEVDGGGGGVEQEETTKGNTNSKEEEEPMETEGEDKPAEEKNSSPVDVISVAETEEEWMTSLRCVSSILGGEKTVALHQEFLIRSNHTDLQILTNTKDSGRNSITHNATVIANGLTHFGTTSDIFLRENLDWLKRASNWAKFTATASLGVIHYGHEKEALNLMSSYLPKDSSGSPYAEGGGLYALGLIHANHGQKIIEYLTKELRTNQNEVVRHGGCYGLGLAGMGTADNDVYELLKDNLCQDDAVVGEAAGLAMGLVMIGTRSPTYAQETQNEKIQRGLALGISMLFYGQLEEADPAIEQLCQHKEALSIIEPMLSDPVPFVQQGALIASALILIQHTEGMSSKSSKIREKYAKIISDKLEDSVAKFGAILAQGIIDVPSLLRLNTC